MMRDLPLKLALTTALVLTAACAKKPKQLPPAPPTSTAPADTMPAPTGPVTGANVPGSSADFIAQSGSDKVLFGLDSYELDQESRDTLDKQAAWLAKYPQVTVSVEGHCDERGTREYNLALGDRRANAAKNYLAGKGVAAARISTISYGKERPEDPASTDDAYARNRRAVTVLVSGAAG